MSSAWKSNVHSLRYPIEIEGRQVTAITLREPSVEVLERIEEVGIEEGKNPTISQTRAVIAALASEPDDVIRKLHRDDFRALAEVVVPLLTGEETA